jgi:hypothetical protein
MHDVVYCVCCRTSRVGLHSIVMPLSIPQSSVLSLRPLVKWMCELYCISFQKHASRNCPLDKINTRNLKGLSLYPVRCRGNYSLQNLNDSPLGVIIVFGLNVSSLVHSHLIKRRTL